MTLKEKESKAGHYFMDTPVVRSKDVLETIRELKASFEDMVQDERALYTSEEIKRLIDQVFGEWD